MRFAIFFLIRSLEAKSHSLARSQGPPPTAGYSAFTAAVAIIRVISRAAVPVVSWMAGGVAAVTSLHR